MRLLIYVEPTSYLLPLWREIAARSRVDTRLVFLEENLTQAWNIDLDDDPRVEVLRGSRGSKLLRIWHLLGDPRTELVNLAGWGHPLLLATLLLAWARGIPVCIESDTQYDPSTQWWRSTLKRLLLPILFRIPQRFFPAGSRQADYFKRYGACASRIRIAQMTVDVRAIASEVQRLRQHNAKETLNNSSAVIASAARQSSLPIKLTVPGSPRRCAPRDDGLNQRVSNGTPTGQGCVFLYVGRLEEYKGIRDLLTAFTRMKGAHGRLVIVGDGSLSDLVRAAAQQNPDIEYLGRLSGEELLRAYARAHVLVLPSRVEPWGLVINEAMAAGLAIVATDRVGCVDDLVHEGVNGLVVPSADPTRLAEAMQTLAGQVGLLAGMGQASSAIIASWTIEDEARILMTNWDELR
jgi:glycosyltransferase involved in cell wall biosynthesis